MVQSRAQIGAAAQHVVHATEPEAATVALNGNGLVGKHLNTFGAKRASHAIRIGGAVVVSHYRPQTVRGLHLPQQSGARFGGRGCCRRVPAGQRRRAISRRTIRGRLGSISVESMASAATPVAAARRMNLRLVVERKGNWFRTLAPVGLRGTEAALFRITRARRFAI